MVTLADVEGRELPTIGHAAGKIFAADGTLDVKPSRRVVSSRRR
ncbi:MAG TPA: hypothetical protein VMN35_05980 [Gaiellaceae bacterium]|nr:hypothetical protein [Gaiellaceae bacterium]